MFCPYCKKSMVYENEHIGLWYCEKCDNTFHIAENPQV